MSFFAVHLGFGFLFVILCQLQLPVSTSISILEQGVPADHLGPLPTKTPIWSGDTDWDANLRTCTNFHFSSMATGQAKNRHVEFPTIFTFWYETPFDVTSLNIRFPQSVMLWRWKLFDTFSGLFTDPFLSGITGLFLHVRCIPHQNLQRLFWASVWFMLDSSRWHEPFGEYLSR